ncbi:zinc finger protein 423-like [Melanaphis sacchari]|uniref:zinc finger protein 423-like n=1 Tax=Melanaphis sacchari TaxID=742174 RepID=UPI000DC15160|nr:zinc finger protein 423-like [Melanaphis sacchari]
MMITPDLENFSTFNVDSSINGEDEYFETPPQVNNVSTETSLVISETEPSRVLPNTGFHFLFATDETVDLTIKEDNTPPKKKPITRKRKNPDTKKAVAAKKVCQKTSNCRHNQKTKNQLPTDDNQQPTTSKQTRTKKKSDPPIKKPRPKRASAIANTPEINNSGLWKLGKYIEGFWSPDTCRISLPLYRCPICDVYYWSIESRQRHEMSAHSTQLNSIHQPIENSAPSEENSASTQQLYLLNYLQLCVKDNDLNAISELAKRTHLLKALKILGSKTIGSFKCNFCPYKTNLMFALWAHMSSTHLKSDFEKKSCLFCFLCNRTVSKRTTLLKHVDKCSKVIIDYYNFCNRLTCTHCNTTFGSLIEIEKHSWRHI